ncbi:MAG TPA: biopolymer transporter ExbD [Vicinamibacterales bacterium]|nr:biopolymer transporter ExbD [Vicinamibacterales bacterium]
MPKLEPIPSAPTRGAGRRGRAIRVSSSLAEINVVPLVDVMLVLLVIFMVAAPMMTQGFPVDLPQSRKSPAINPEPVTVTVPATFRRDQRLRLGTELIPLSVLSERVKQALDNENKKNVILAPDGAVTMQDVFLVFDALQEAGVHGLSIQSQPPATRRAR